MRRPALVLGAALAAALPASDALACSCIPEDARIQESKVAFTGTPIKRVRIGGQRVTGDRHRYTFRVDRVWRGELPERVVLTAGGQGASCGTGFRLQREVSLVLYRRYRAGRSVGLCNKVRRSALARAARPLPEPAGSGTAAALVTGRYGTNGSLVALDRAGKLLAYGLGARDAPSAAVCPGSTTLLQAGSRLHVRSLADLRVSRSQKLSKYVLEMRCLTEDGSRAVASVTGVDDMSPVSLAEITPDGLRPLARTAQSPFVLGPDRAYVTGGTERRPTLHAVDYATKARTRLVDLPGTPMIGALDPTGGRLAFVTEDFRDNEYRLAVLDLATNALRTREVSYQVVGDLLWLPGDRIAVTAEDRLLSYSAGDLQQVAGVRAPYGASLTLVEDQVWALQFDAANLLSAPASGGTPRTLVKLPGRSNLDILATPDITSWESISTERPRPIGADRAQAGAASSSVSRGCRAARRTREA